MACAGEQAPTAAATSLRLQDPDETVQQPALGLEVFGLSNQGFEMPPSSLFPPQADHEDHLMPFQGRPLALEIDMRIRNAT